MHLRIAGKKSRIFPRKLGSILSIEVYISLLFSLHFYRVLKRIVKRWARDFLKRRMRTIVCRSEVEENSPLWLRKGTQGATCAEGETSNSGFFFRGHVASRESIRVAQDRRTFAPKIDGKNWCWKKFTEIGVTREPFCVTIFLHRFTFLTNDTVIWFLRRIHFRRCYFSSIGYNVHKL